MWKQTCIIIGMVFVVSGAALASRHHHRQPVHHHTFKERFDRVYSLATFNERFGMWFGKYYLGDDPDINIRFELRRDFARIAH